MISIDGGRAHQRTYTGIKLASCHHSPSSLQFQTAHISVIVNQRGHSPWVIASEPQNRPLDVQVCVAEPKFVTDMIIEPTKKETKVVKMNPITGADEPDERPSRWYERSRIGSDQGGGWNRWS